MTEVSSCETVAALVIAADDDVVGADVDSDAVVGAAAAAAAAASAFNLRAFIMPQNSLVLCTHTHT